MTPLFFFFQRITEMQARVQVKWRKQVYEIEVALDRPVLALKTQVEPLAPLSPVYAPVVGRTVTEGRK